MIKIINEGVSCGIYPCPGMGPDPGPPHKEGNKDDINRVMDCSINFKERELAQIKHQERIQNKWNTLDKLISENCRGEYEIWKHDACLS